jgi:FlaA1/EpsC-like NDP-sugar epimerase
VIVIVVVRVLEPVSREPSGRPFARFRNRYLLAGDLVLLPLSAYASFVLRFDSVRLHGAWPACLLFVALTMILVPFIFSACGLYSRYWPYASFHDLPPVLAGVGLLATAVSALYLAVAETLLSSNTQTGSPSIPVIFFMIALGSAGGSRYLMRLLATALYPPAANPAARNTIVIGAGEAGSMTVRELRRNPQLGHHVVGFVDDDPAKRGMRIQGLRVLGSRSDLPDIVAEFGVDRAIIAMPSAPGRVVREMVQLCELSGVTPQILPGLFELLNGRAKVEQIRNVEIADLLRREPVRTDLAAVRALLEGKRILITGAGGSIGSELCRQVLTCGPAEIILLGHGENSIFDIHGELERQVRRNASTEARTVLTPVIADIRLGNRLLSVFLETKPQMVFHAAAHKHVPLMEVNPSDAVTNNVLGTRNVIEAAAQAAVERFVFVSTDKAVNPTSVMGATKRVAEMLVQHAALETERPYLSVRFGNVLGSRGSVVLTMKQQIASGGPVTVTDPEMARYFMTIPEAVQLVLQAAVMGRGNEVFVFDMGDPVRIVDLAHDLIHLSGLKPGEDIEITFTGARAGEKLKEELFLSSERYGRTSHPKIYTLASDTRPLPDGAVAMIDDLVGAAVRDERATVVRLLGALLPGFGSERAGRSRLNGSTPGASSTLGPDDAAPAASSSGKPLGPFALGKAPDRAPTGNGHAPAPVVADTAVGEQGRGQENELRPNGDDRRAD